MSQLSARKSLRLNRFGSHRHCLVVPTSVLVLAFALTAGGCKKDDAKKAEPATGETPAQKPTTTTDKPAVVKELTVYSGRTEKLVGPALKAFEKESGIKLKVKYAGTAELAAALLDEGSGSPADVFIAQDASSLGFLEGKDRFVALPQTILDRVPEQFRSSAGRWVGLTGRARVLAYNTSKLKPDQLPKTAAELTEATWKGRLGWAPANASFQSAIAAMIQLEGADVTKAWLKGVKANKPSDYPKNTPAVLAVSRGEVDVALVNHYYLYRLRAEHGESFPVANHYFKDGSAHSMVNLSGAAIVSSSKKKSAGETLIGFLLSDAGQKIFVEANHEFPVAGGVASPSGLPAIAEIGAPKINLADLRDLKATHELLRSQNVLP